MPAAPGRRHDAPQRLAALGDQGRDAPHVSGADCPCFPRCRPDGPFRPGGLPGMVLIPHSRRRAGMRGMSGEGMIADDGRHGDAPVFSNGHLLPPVLTDRDDESAAEKAKLDAIEESVGELEEAARWVDEQRKAVIKARHDFEVAVRAHERALAKVRGRL